MDFEIKIVNTGDGLYGQMLELREEVLRKPLGLSLFSEKLNEEADFHIAAGYNGQLTGCLVLTPLSGTVLKMRQVAVKSEARRQGAGAQIVRFAERLAGEKGFTKIVLNARLTAVEFYRKLDYVCEGGEFLEVGIPHLKMFKVLV